MQLRPHQEQAIQAMIDNDKGQVIVPTGGGKTICMIQDAKNELSRTNTLQTIVVVAPRILLANQLSAEFLEHIIGVDVMHVHSGETHHFSTTNVDKITFSSSYYCYNFLPKQIVMEELDIPPKKVSQRSPSMAVLPL